MQVWSTDDVPVHERFAVWREWRAAQVFGLTVDIDQSARRSFQARIASRPIGAAFLVELCASAYRARRTSQDIGRVRSDSLCFYQQTAGPGWTALSGRREPFAFGIYDIAIGYSDLPYETLPRAAETFRTRLIRIPLTREQDPDNRRERMPPRLLRATPGLDALLQDYVQSLFRNAAHLDADAAAAAIDVLARLALLTDAGSRNVAAMDGGVEAVASARLTLVQAYVCDNLHRADLTPEMTARAFRVSLRQLHRLFEGSGTTFAKFLIRKRIERVASLLSTTRKTSIIETAFACGFSGSSVFYRAFKSHYGLNPQDYLRSLGDRLHPVA